MTRVPARKVCLQRGQTELERATASFNAKVQRAGIDECWNWTGAKDKRGYGSLRFNRRTFKAHRLSFLIENGYLPAIIDHVCNNPACCNPRHLREATQHQNMGRSRKRLGATGYRGVWLSPHRNDRWSAFIGDNPRVYLGMFGSPEEAAAAYNRAAIARWGADFVPNINPVCGRCFRDLRTELPILGRDGLDRLLASFRADRCATDRGCETCDPADDAARLAVETC